MLNIMEVHETKQMIEQDVYKRQAGVMALETSAE